jgi:multiple sugar transport system substrate-binding protein
MEDMGRRGNRARGKLLNRREILKGIGGIGAAWATSSLMGTRGEAAGDRVLRFWHSYTQATRVVLMKQAGADFEKANPGVRVEIEVIPWPQLYQKWTTAFAANALPDVIVAKNDNYIGMWVAGAILPVDDIIASLGGDKAFLPGFLDRHVRMQGHTIAVPHYTTAPLIIYRKDLFKEKGLKPPTTWEEALRVGAALTKPPKQYGWQQYFSPNDQGGTMWPLYTAMASNGGEFFDKDGNVIFNRPENVAAVEFLKELTLVAASPSAVTMNWSEEEWDVMGSGRSAMLTEALFAFSAIDKLVPGFLDKLDAAELPRGPKKQLAGASAPACITLAKGQNSADGKKFIAFLLENDRYIQYLHTVPGALCPVTVAAQNSPAFWNEPLIQKKVEAVRLEIDVAARSYYQGLRYGLHPWFTVIDDTPTLPNMMAKILANHVPVGRAVADAHAEIEKSVADLKARSKR